MRALSEKSLEEALVRLNAARGSATMAFTPNKLIVPVRSAHKLRKFFVLAASNRFYHYLQRKGAR